MEVRRRTPVPTIDPARVLSHLRTLRSFGAYKTGVHRPTFSPVDMEARHWFAAGLAEAGLEPKIDGIGSVFGYSRASGPKLLTGSHLESQNYAGWLDGPLGCVYGLEAARALGEDAACADLGVDVAAWCDEEGHFGSFLGSRSFVGLLSEEEIDRAQNRYDGTPLREALDKAGLSGRPRLQFEAGRHTGYVEAHIEQGDTLERGDLAVPPHGDGRAEPRRHDRHGAPPRRRAGARAAPRRDRPALPRACRTAHSLDLRPHHARARRAEHHPGPRGGAAPNPRRRPGRARAPPGRAAPPRRGG